MPCYLAAALKKTADLLEIASTGMLLQPAEYLLCHFCDGRLVMPVVNGRIVDNGFSGVFLYEIDELV